MMMHAWLRSTRRGALALLALAVAAASLPLTVVAAPAAAAAAAKDSEALVEGLAGEAWRILNQEDTDRPAKLQELAGLFEARTDMDLLARLALGRNWNRLSAAQQERYTELFRKVIVRRLAERLESYARDATGPVADHFQLVGAQPAGKADMLVRSRVLPRSGRPLSVDWRVRTLDDGPVIIDLIIEGVSLLISQRSEFTTVIEQRSVDGLLAELEARAGAIGS